MIEINFTDVPKAIYYPGDSFINSHLDRYEISSEKLILDFTDSGDGAISHFISDWGNIVADPERKYSFRKSDLLASIKIVVTDSFGFCEFNFLNCCVSSTGNNSLRLCLCYDGCSVYSKGN